MSIIYGCGGEDFPSIHRLSRQPNQKMISCVTTLDVAKCGDEASITRDAPYRSTQLLCSGMIAADLCTRSRKLETLRSAGEPQPPAGPECSDGG